MSMTLPRRTSLAGAFGPAVVSREPGVASEESQRPGDEEAASEQERA